MLKFSIITPCYNAENYIGETIESVLSQTALLSGRVELQYIICDGASTDKTAQIARQYSHPGLQVVSEPDAGMYDALTKGLKLVNGDICAYINAGDYYSTHAFDIVADIFDQHNQVKWLTGMSVIYNERAHVVSVDLPFKYRRRLIMSGFYGTKLNWIQQESTFWHSSLNGLIDYEQLKSFKYAGDFYLWYSFAHKEELRIVSAYLGGFKHHKGQLSENSEKYFSEFNRIRRKPDIHDYILYLKDRPIWKKGAKYKKRYNRNGLFIFDHTTQTWI